MGAHSLADQSVGTLLPASVETKNTFVHFAARSPLARRGTCAGRLITVPEKKTRLAVARNTTRSVTCMANVSVATVRIPELADGEFRRLSASSLSDSAPSPTSPLCLCLETPTTLFLPSPRTAAHSPWATPMPFERCYATQGYTQGLSQGCVTPVSCATPISSLSTPRSAWHLPSQLLTPCSPSLLSSPPLLSAAMSPSLSPASTPPVTPRTAPSDDLVRKVAGLLQAVEPKPEPKKRSRKHVKVKVVIPAKASEMTLMLRHLPLVYTPDGLLAEFIQFLPFIDFYYLPTNFETKKNMGYAFLNFTDRAVATKFTQFWEERGIAEVEDRAVVEARVQGCEENVERFRNSSVMPMLPLELKPRIFAAGVQQVFPAADGVVPPVGPRFRPTGN